MPVSKANALVNKAKGYHDRGDNDNCMKYCNLAIQIDPNYAKGYFARALLLAEYELFEAAIADFNKAMGLNFVNDLVLFHRADAYMSIGNFKKAVSDLTQAMEYDPENPEIYRMRGAAYIQLNFKNKAMEDLNRALELDPYDPIAYYVRATCYMMSNDITNTLENLNQAIKLEPGSPLTYFARASIYESIGEKEKAEADFQKAQELGYEEDIFESLMEEFDDEEIYWQEDEEDDFEPERIFRVIDNRDKPEREVNTGDSEPKKSKKSKKGSKKKKKK